MPDQYNSDWDGTDLRSERNQFPDTPKTDISDAFLHASRVWTEALDNHDKITAQYRNPFMWVYERLFGLFKFMTWPLWKIAEWYELKQFDKHSGD